MSHHRGRATWSAIVEPREAVLQDLTPQDAHRAGLLHTMGLLLTAAGFLFSAPGLVFWLHPALPALPWTDILLDTLVVTCGPLTLWFVRSGRLRSAAWTVLSLLLVGSAIRLFVEGQPVTDIAARPSLLLTVALAFVLLARRGAWLVTAAFTIILVSMHLLWWGGYLPPPASRDRLSQLLFSITGWVVLAAILAAVLYATMRALRDQARTLRQRLKQLTLLSEISEKITRMLDVERLLEAAVHSLHGSFGYQSVAILTLDEAQGTLTTQAVAGQLASLVPHDHSQRLGEGLIGWAARHRETVLVKDVAAAPRCANRYPQQAHTQSALCVPIHIGDRLLGVLDAQSDNRSAFDENDRTVLETLAGQIAMALEDARPYQAERAAQRQVRDLFAYLQNAREEERTHIAREILDDFGQLLTALQMDLSWLVNRLPSDRPRLPEKIKDMSPPSSMSPSRLSGVFPASCAPASWITSGWRPPSDGRRRPSPSGAESPPACISTEKQTCWIATCLLPSSASSRNPWPTWNTTRRRPRCALTCTVSPTRLRWRSQTMGGASRFRRCRDPDPSGWPACASEPRPCGDKCASKGFQGKVQGSSHPSPESPRSRAARRRRTRPLSNAARFSLSQPS